MKGDWETLADCLVAKVTLWTPCLDSLPCQETFSTPCQETFSMPSKVTSLLPSWEGKVHVRVALTDDIRYFGV